MYGSLAGSSKPYMVEGAKHVNHIFGFVTWAGGGGGEGLNSLNELMQIKNEQKSLALKKF
jgi:hypothetical protein